MKWLSLIGLLVLVACGEEQSQSVYTLEVKKEPFVVKVRGEGVLHAQKSTPITVPPMRERPTLGWMADEGVFYKKGDVLVRFDRDALVLRKEGTQSELKKLGFQRKIDNRDLGLQERGLEGDVDLLDVERDQKQRFAPKDERVYSRNEIIESEINLDFLSKKKDYLGEKLDRHRAKADTQEAIHQLNIKQNELQIDQLDDSLKQLEITAPNDGYFYYQRNWKGEPFQVGQNLWRGVKLGEMPDLQTIEARVYVLEKDAAGLKPGLKAELELDAKPGERLEGEVRQVATLAKPRDRNSPVKYFEVNITIENFDVNLLRPGSGANAVIYTHREAQAISLPNQSIFQENGDKWVYVKQGDGFEKRVVETGTRSPTRTAIVSGLEVGDFVAMSKPAEDQL